ncbi:MAG: molecular chaperone DnaJ [Xanthobacteraceae bacterium]|nr:MAG: molecular chaperone DnaJ [Xanthobacteraceae bacterium]
MKFDSLFDSIRVKPSADRTVRADDPGCEWPGCASTAAHRAPKGRGRDRDYWRFCLAHVREYNQSYNYFAGMSDDAVAQYQKDALTGHRPTWKLGVNAKGAHAERPDFTHAGDPFGLFGDLNGRRKVGADAPPKPEGRMVFNAERKALRVMGLEAGATTEEVKLRFKRLVKQHHPDANGGDRSSEDRLRDIIQAYKYLKTKNFT